MINLADKMADYGDKPSRRLHGLARIIGKGRKIFGEIICIIRILFAIFAIIK